MTNLKSFNAALRKATKRLTTDALVDFQSLIALHALRGIVLKTPVDTGRARGNWQLNIGSPATGALEVTDRNGGATISQGAARLKALRPFQVVHITNNVEYIEFLENGSSQQAPAGMVAATLAEIQAGVL